MRMPSPAPLLAGDALAPNAANPLHRPAPKASGEAARCSTSVVAVIRAGLATEGRVCEALGGGRCAMLANIRLMI